MLDKDLTKVLPLKPTYVTRVKVREKNFSAIKFRGVFTGFFSLIPK